MILGEVKARPKDIISFSLDYISKSKVQTSNPSSSPIPLDTPVHTYVQDISAVFTSSALTFMYNIYNILYTWICCFLCDIQTNMRIWSVYDPYKIRI